MPELPEVETVVKLLSTLKNRNIEKIEIKKPSLLKTNNIVLLKNETIRSVERKGKYIFFLLDNFVLIVHLRMAGKFFFEKHFNFFQHQKSLVFTIFFKDNSKIFFCDSRNFATIHIQKISNYKEIYPYNSIGLDLLNDFIENDILFRNFHNRRITIKSALLTQNIISGIGNIYASEILFLSKINPFTETNKISKIDYEKIIFFSKKVIKRAVEMNGCSVFDFLNPFNEPGSYQKELKVYNRNGMDCFECKNSIEKDYIDNRSTFFCRFCQKV